MQFNRRTGMLALCLFAAFASPPGWAQDYPTKPIRIVVPLPPGGSNDVLARLLGQKMSESFGQPVIVENKPGAAGNIASEFMARAEGDGYYIAVAPNQTVAVNPVLYPKLPFDVNRDLTGITMMGRVPMVLVVSPAKVQATTVAELIALAKANPEKLSYASAGSGSPQHMAAEVFKSLTGTKLTQIPYRGSAPALVDVLGGQVDVMFCPMNSALPHIRSGKLRAGHHRHQAGRFAAQCANDCRDRAQLRKRHLDRHGRPGENAAGHHQQTQRRVAPLAGIARCAKQAGRAGHLRRNQHAR